MPSHYLRPTEGKLCEWCKSQRATDNHHLRFKSHGGTDKGYTLQIYIDEAGNIWHLCPVCHAAAHGNFLITLDGFNCLVCPLIQYCDAGRLQAKRKGVTVPEPNIW
jgi:hypothetical protein